jgi:hypothetical protein
VAIVALVIGQMESGRHSYRLKVCGELVSEGLCACKLAWTHTPRLRHGESWKHWAHQNPSQIELDNYSQMHAQHNEKVAFSCTAISSHRSDRRQLIRYVGVACFSCSPTSMIIFGFIALTN